LGGTVRPRPAFGSIFKLQTKTANQNRKPKLQTTTAGHKLQTTNYRPQTTDHKLQTTNCKPQTANELELIEGGALAQIESEVRPQA